MQKQMLKTLQQDHCKMQVSAKQKLGIWKTEWSLRESHFQEANLIWYIPEIIVIVVINKK